MRGAHGSVDVKFKSKELKGGGGFQMGNISYLAVNGAK